MMRHKSYFLDFRDDAEMEYLKIAQDLEMYGINYFQIRVSTVSYELRSGKTCLRAFRPGPTQTGLYSLITWLITWLEA